MSDLGPAAIREAIALHEVFEAWLSSGEAAFSRIEAALDPAFRMVPPDGRLVARQEVLDRLAGAAGARGAGFRIAVEEPFVLAAPPGQLLLHYLERQRTPAAETLRRSAALFRADPAGPNGLRWLFLQETWIVPPG
ncbi:MAG: hypothetical protein N2Z67_01985 [Acetobacteraceae bacterium]|nr:hypothetical protein [Acetobacteraceae bacterium]